MNLPACLRPHRAVIAEISDERRDGDGYWVYLATGLWSPEDETHCVHEDTPRACAAKLRRVEPCPCCRPPAGQKNAAAV